MHSLIPLSLFPHLKNEVPVRVNDIPEVPGQARLSDVLVVMGEAFRRVTALCSSPPLWKTRVQNPREVRNDSLPMHQARPAAPGSVLAIFLIAQLYGYSGQE